MPPSGQRERVGDMVVITRCDMDYCVDGLRDDRRGQELMTTALTEDEKELASASATFERAVRIAHLTEDSVSVYEGFTEYSGGAHANNSLACSTWNRRTGRRVLLSELSSATKGKALEARAAILLQEFLDETGRPGYEIDEASFLYDGLNQRVVLCALAPYVVAGTIVEIPMHP